MTSSVCSAFDPLIAERASGALDAAATATLDAHLAGCARCRAELAAWQETFGLARLPAPADAERLAVVAQLPARVRAELRSGQVRTRTWRALALGFAAASAVAVVVANRVELPFVSRHAGSPVTAAWQEPDPEALLQRVVKEHAELAVVSEEELARAEVIADAAYQRVLAEE